MPFFQPPRADGINGSISVRARLHLLVLVLVDYAKLDHAKQVGSVNHTRILNGARDDQWTGFM